MELVQVRTLGHGFGNVHVVFSQFARNFIATVVVRRRDVAGAADKPADLGWSFL